MASFKAKPRISEDEDKTHSLELKSFVCVTITPTTSTNNTTKICPISSPTLNPNKLQKILCSEETMNRMAFA